MAAEQLSAAFIAAVLFALGAAALVRSTSIYVVVALGLLVTVPFAGLVTYAVAPRPLPDSGRFVDLALIPALIALAAGVYAVVGAANRSKPLTPGTLDSLVIAYVVLWIGIVLAISAFLALWEPAFAIANLVLNALWLLFWVVPRTRSLRGTTAVEIAAPRDRVFAFMTDSANWASYDEQLVSATPAPPGALRAGSRVTEVRHFDSPVRGPRMLPQTVEVVTEVTDMVPGVSFDMRDGRHIVRSTTSYAETAGGTTVSIDVRISVPFHQAFLGGILMLRSTRDVRRARAERNLARLKALLEQQHN